MSAAPAPVVGHPATIKGLTKRARLDGSGLKVAVIRTLWNTAIIDALAQGCIEELRASGVTDIVEYTVPGAYELPFAANRVIKSKAPDAVVAIGCLIKGDTPHFEMIAESVSHGLMKVGLDTDVPVVFGVLTCLTEDQALLRAGLKPGYHNHGPEWGTAAVTMARLARD